MTKSIHFGNAATDGSEHRGWLVGHFIGDPQAVRHSGDVEIKWGLHPAGQRRDGWVTGETATTLCMLIAGRFRVRLSDGDYLLARQGDYVMWGPGVDHLWEAEEDSTVLTVRWPSGNTSAAVGSASTAPRGQER